MAVKLDLWTIESFEELQPEEVRWPRHGDRAFRSSSDPRMDAQIHPGGFRRIDMMIQGYREAAEMLVRRAEETPDLRHALVYPILFSYRQYLELSLKYFLSTYGALVSVKAVWKSHDLLDLWTKLVTISKAYGESDEDESRWMVGQVVAQFAKADPGSFAYRFPVDPKGRVIRLRHASINLPNLAKTMGGVRAYFDSLDGYLDVIRDKAT